MNLSVYTYTAVDIAVPPFAERNYLSKLFKAMVCLENLRL